MFYFVFRGSVDGNAVTLEGSSVIDIPRFDIANLSPEVSMVIAGEFGTTRAFVSPG